VWGAYTVTGPLLGKRLQKRFETFISAVANASSVTVFAALFLVRTLPRELHRGLHGCVLCTRVAEVPQRDSPVPRARVCAFFQEGSRHSKKLCFHSQKTSHFKKQWWPPVLTTPNAFRALCATGDAWSTAAYFSVRALISVLLCS
jgi:hypothetical protein